MKHTEQIFLETVEKYHMLEPGDRVLAAVSGGADSVCLLALLAKMEQRLDIQVRALHVHHGLRGAEADRDADFTETICRKLGVPVRIVRADVRRYAREERLSEETAGRIVRYQILERAAEEWEQQDPGPGRVRIGTAHHGDDQAETIFHNFCRGSGLAGLGGMRPVRGRIIRPLLELRRSQIEAWLKNQGLSWCQDSTNLETDYTRNRIRNTILPLVCSQVNQKAVENILGLGRLAAWADDCLREQAREWVQSKAEILEEMIRLPVQPFEQLEEILRSYVVWLCMEELAGSAKDLSQRHVEAVKELFSKQAGRFLTLPYGLRARREYQHVVLEKAQNNRQPEAPQQQAPGIWFQTFSWEKGMEIPKNQYTKWFDCDKIRDTLQVRTRRSGDYITLPEGKRKSLRRLMIDEKIPREERDRIWLLADGSHIMWIIGYRISEYYKIGPCTVRVLQARVDLDTDKGKDKREEQEDGR